MPDAGPLRGLEAGIALWRLLSVRGIDLPLDQLREQSAIDDTLDSLQIALAQHGVHARGVYVGELNEMAALETPTLLQRVDGSWLLMRACRRDRVIVEGAEGLVTTTLAALAPQLAGQALELSPRLPDGVGLWPRLVKLLQAHRRTLVQFAIASLMLQLLALLTPELTGLVMGRALPDGASQLLLLVAAAIVAASVFTGAVGWLRERIVLYLLTRMEVALKRGFLEHVLRLPFPELQRRSRGELLQAFYGITSSRALLAERSLGALFDGVLAVGFLILMGVKLLAPTLLLLVVVAAMAVVAVWVGRAQARVQIAEVAAQARQRGYLTELIGGIRTIKAAGAEQRCQRQWLQRFDAELTLVLRRQRIGLWSDVGLQTLRQASSTALLVWGGYSVLQGHIGIGTLFSFMLLAEGFLNAVMALITTYLMLIVASRQLTGARELLGLQATPAAVRSHGEKLSGPIVMKDVWFRYACNEPWILEGYDLQIEPGEKYQIDGPSGCGKSTILRLLAGLYVPERGTITIAGQQVPSTTARMLYLPQFVQLNAGSIADNLRNLSGGASPQRLRDTAAKTGFDEVTATMVMGYHTPLLHSGRTLSGGQRQLLALTAALASDCDLLLLDEPMANIDRATQASLEKIISGESRTIISVGHV